MNNQTGDKHVLPSAMQSRLPSYWRLAGIVTVVVLLTVSAAWFFWPRSGEGEVKGDRKAGAQGAAGAARGGRFGADPNRLQPVTAVAAKLGDMHIIQGGLGTVNALKTVTVKVRVDGQLQSVLFREGQLVQAGEVLAQIDPATYQAQLLQVEGQMARDQALLANARIDLERYRMLLAQDSVAKQQLDAQESLVRQYEGVVKADQGQLDNARLQMGYTKVTAPIAGRLGLRQVDAGNMVRATDANGLVVITQIDPVSVLFTIPQDSLPRVLARLKNGERLGVEVWDREEKIKLATGFLLSVDNQIDVATGTVKLKAQLPNAEGNLFPNQFVNVRMTVDTRRDAVLIPIAAVQRGTQGAVVYVVKEDKTVTMRPLKLGTVEKDSVAVEAGVVPGELVVTDGIDRLREGAKVDVIVPGAVSPRSGTPGGRDPGKRGQRRGGNPEAPADAGKPAG
jgi:multidrug efflux system membrane fusion protein